MTTMFPYFPLPIAEDIRDPPKKEKGRTVQALSAQARIGRRHCHEVHDIHHRKKPSTNSLRIAPDTSVTPE